MYSKDPVWLLPEDILRKYEEFCFINNITERRLVRLFDTFLLRGRGNRKSKKVEILQESFEDIMKHIEYNFYKRTGNKSDLPVKIPEYLKYKYRIFYDSALNWYTPSEILNTYCDILKNETFFTCEFLGDLVMMGLIVGKYSPRENCYYILLTSFVELMKLREHSVRQYLLLPPPDEPPKA